MNADAPRHPGFAYSPMFPLGEDKTVYRKLDISGVSTIEVEGKAVLKISPTALEELAFAAFHDVAHLGFLRVGQIQTFKHHLRPVAHWRFVHRLFAARWRWSQVICCCMDGAGCTKRQRRSQ